MTTATVETLTAEVRTLVVGKRQVTLSVYRQLDSAPLEEVEPFGRVRDDKDTGYAKGGHVVGRHHQTGALVRAAYTNITSIETALITAADLDGGAIILCPRRRGENWVFEDRLFRLSFPVGERIVIIEVDPDAVTTCGVHNTTSREKCAGWNPNGHDERIRSVILAAEEDAKPHRAAAKLPLIVLAGLK